METAVLANPIDPYYPLAQEIAQTENIPLFQSRSEALATQPTYLLWVVSPAYLSDAALIAMGQSLSEQSVALGIISASTLEQARALWLRAKEVKGEVFVAVNAANPAANIESKITVWQGEQSQTLELSKANLLYFLQRADYLTFTGHGGNRYWRLDAETRLKADDLHSLAPIVVQSASCNTFRIWEKDSIALAFVEQGAAAYVGFAYSPNEGYLIGEFDGLPYRYSYPDFSIGAIVRLQNRGTLQGFAAFPYLFLLGDPRLSLQKIAPYQLVEDRLEGSNRTLIYRDVPKGMVPIRIKGGAGYSYVQVVGISATDEQDSFYNNRLQMMDVGEDKFLLIDSKGGKLNLKLLLQPPWYWPTVDVLSDSLDFALIFLPQSGGDWMSFLFVVFPLGWVVWQIKRKRWQKHTMERALIVGSVSSILLGGYALLRAGSISITSKIVAPSYLGLAVNWFLACSGAWMFFASPSVWKKWIALMVLLFPFWFPLLYGGVVVEGFNRLIAIPLLGVPLYNHHSTQQSLIALLLVGCLYGFLLINNHPNRAITDSE